MRDWPQEARPPDTARPSSRIDRSRPPEPEGRRIRGQAPPFEMPGRLVFHSLNKTIQPSTLIAMLSRLTSHRDLSLGPCGRGVAVVRGWKCSCHRDRRLASRPSTRGPSTTPCPMAFQEPLRPCLHAASQNSRPSGGVSLRIEGLSVPDKLFKTPALPFSKVSFQKALSHSRRLREEEQGEDQEDTPQVSTLMAPLGWVGVRR